MTEPATPDPATPGPGSAPDTPTSTQAPASKLSSGGRTALMGAMFLMATAAIGPGFITQTTVFTVELGAAFAFAIVVSVLVDIALQLNIWRVIGISGLRAQQLANRLLPGLGWVMATLIVIGGLAFNIGNVSGAGLGTDAMFGLDPRIGGVISAAIAIGIFLSRRAGIAMDRLVILLGAVMITLTLYVALTSSPPVGEAMRNVVLPENINFFAITTLIGGTIGGYITYAGAHRLIDNGISGRSHLRQITNGSVIGIIITGVMRIVLFLAVLGVVAGGATLGGDNPAAEAFQHAAGEVGLRVFGIVLWAAAITSVIGASYTSVSFLTTSRTSDRIRTLLVIIFITVSTVIFVIANQAPATILVAVGAFNGLLLPIGVTVILWVAWRRRDLLDGYKYPAWLLIIGAAAWLLTIYLGWNSLSGLGELFG